MKHGPVPAGVYSFHGDSATVMADTYLCSFLVAPSESSSNEDAWRRLGIPETRTERIRRHGGVDDVSFKASLGEHFCDLRCIAVPDARLFFVCRGQPVAHRPVVYGQFLAAVRGSCARNARQPADVIAINRVTFRADFVLA